MELKRRLSILFTVIFFIFLFIYSEYLEYIQLNEIYRLILILSLFIINMMFTINMNHIEDKVYKKLRIPYIIFWSLTFISISSIIVLSLESVLFICTILFIVYMFIKVLIYKKIYKDSRKMVILKFSKFKSLSIIIVLIRYNGFSVI